MEGVEQLREVSRTVDARSGEEAGDRESPEFSHSAGKGLCEMPVSLRKRPVCLRKDWSGRPDLNRASCVQASRAISWKSFLFNLVFENKRVRKIFGSGTMYRNVAPHAWSPPISPSAKKQRNAFTDVRLLRNPTLRLTERAQCYLAQM